MARLTEIRMISVFRMYWFSKLEYSGMRVVCQFRIVVIVITILVEVTTLLVQVTEIVNKKYVKILCVINTSFYYYYKINVVASVTNIMKVIWYNAIFWEHISLEMYLRLPDDLIILTMSTKTIKNYLFTFHVASKHFIIYINIFN